MQRATIAIATRGRRDVVEWLLPRLEEQSAPPQRIIVVGCGDSDLPRAPSPRVQTLVANQGLTIQRNAALSLLDGSEDVLVFFDDDFVPSRFWIERVCGIFDEHRAVAAVTGAVLADGATTSGLDPERGLDIVRRADAALTSARPYTLTRNAVPYGCNMAYRVEAIRDLRFDERLVLYGWQEDRDFGARVAERGDTIATDAIWGVHLGAKNGRVSGRRLGYSQVANPYYLMRKGTMAGPAAASHVMRNLLANAAKALRPEPYVDRRGRLVGNLIGLSDLLHARLRPERALDL